MIRARRFSRWVMDTIRIVNEERNEKAMWEMWLYKVQSDISYGDFRDQLKNTKAEKPTKSELKKYVKDSKKMLSGFVPNEQ